MATRLTETSQLRKRNQLKHPRVHPVYAGVRLPLQANKVAYVDL
ncbi:hypothetical protein [Aliiglaciecola litoralis]